MFKKRLCKKCGKKAGAKDNFCSNCGMQISSSEDFGMLGKSDETNEFEQFSKELLGGFGGNMMNKMFNSAIKMLEKEMQKEMKNQPQHQTNIQLFVNGRRVDASRPSKRTDNKESKRKIILPNANLHGFSGLPREEPEINMRRFPEKIVYEINMPGVKSADDVSIVPLESSIEIKALAKNKSYFKLIPVSLPISNYRFSEGKLILEIDA